MLESLSHPPMIGSAVPGIRTTALAVLLLTAAGCGEAVVINVGPAGDTDSCTSTSSSPCGADPALQGWVSYALWSASCPPSAPPGTVCRGAGDILLTPTTMMTPKAARQDGPYLSIAAVAPDGSEIDIRVWTGASNGNYFCEDPATAQRTRIDLSRPQNGVFYLTTISGGNCSISVSPLSDALEGSFGGELLPYSGQPTQPQYLISGAYYVFPQRPL
jgi:hypothetical protein